jgi:hypothetical protein
MRINRIGTALISLSVFTTIFTAPAFADAKYPGTPGSGLGKTVVKTLVIPFKNDVASPSATQIYTIRSSARMKDVKFTVAGYASKVGDEKYNLLLSRARAKSIANQILDIRPNANVFSKGFGILKNEACNKYENRCVVVTIFSTVY